MMPISSSLKASGVKMMTESGGVSDDKVGTIRTLRFEVVGEVSRQWVK